MTTEALERDRRSILHARAAGLIDAAIAAALFAATVAYVASWPRDLVPLDEGLFVYESARMLFEGRSSPLFERIESEAGASSEPPSSTGPAR